jgi:lysophospholipase L1-like esterase
VPRRIFPAASVTNTTGAPMRLTFHYTQAGGVRASDLWTVDGSNYISAGIPNGIVLTDASGSYSAFAGPDDIDTLWVTPHTGAARTQITATASVATSSASASRSDLGLGAAAVMSTAQIAADGALTGTYAGVKTRGNRFVFLGDSLTLGGDVVSSGNRNSSWPNYAALITKQQIFYVRNAGVTGNTSAQMLARFDTDVTPYTPTVVTLLAGRNDIGGAVSLATFQANMQAIVAKIRAIGASPVLCTIPPTTSTAGITTAQWNQWIRVYAASIGAPLLDFYNILVDPATGSYLSGYDSGDHIHPNAAGYFAMGQHAATVLGTLLPAFYPPVPNDKADTSNLVANCCFTTTALNGNGEPTGFFVLNPASTTNTVETGDTTIKGNWLKMTVSTAASAPELYKTGYAVTVGDIYIFTARVKTNLSAGNFTANLIFSGASPSARYAIFQETAVLDGTLYWVGAAPTGATSIQIHFALSAGSTGYAQVAQVGLYDATTLGLGSLLP